MKLGPMELIIVVIYLDGSGNTDNRSCSNRDILRS